MAGTFDNGFYGRKQNFFYGVAETVPERETGSVVQYGGAAYGQNEYAGELPRDVFLAGTAAGTSSVVGALNVTRPLAGVVAAVATVVGVGRVTHPLAGLSSAIASTISAVGVARPLAGVSNIITSTPAPPVRLTLGLRGELGWARVIPDAILLQTNFAGALAAVQDAPRAPDQVWMTATGTAILRLSFPTPTNLVDGKQEFRILVRP